MRMAGLSLCLILLPVLMPTKANADVARICQSDPPKTEIAERSCTLMLISVIDTLQALNIYCPDGKTSYGFLTQAWRRDLEKYPEAREIPTARSMIATMRKLELLCK